MNVGRWFARAKSHKLLFFGALLLVVLIMISIVGVIVRAPAKKDIGHTGNVILKGKLVCLPHTNSDGPQTLECATGFKSDAGKYYVIKDDDAGSPVLTDKPFNQPVEVTGSFYAEEGSTYPTVGTITAQSISEQ